MQQSTHLQLHTNVVRAELQTASYYSTIGKDWPFAERLAELALERAARHMVIRCGLIDSTRQPSAKRRTRERKQARSLKLSLAMALLASIAQAQRVLGCKETLELA